MKDREQVATNGRAIFYASMWNDLRQAAMDKGWALALHGSLANDMDILAMPWTEEAEAPLDMINALKKCFTESERINIDIAPMPNGRVVYTLPIWADFFLDINIISRPITLKEANEATKGDYPDVYDYPNSVERYRSERGYGEAIHNSRKEPELTGSEPEIKKMEKEIAEYKSENDAVEFGEFIQEYYRDTLDEAGINLIPASELYKTYLEFKPKD